MSWQPIETAPKDGTAVLAYWRALTCEPSDAECYGITLHKYGDWIDPEDSTILLEPTHWMPLPAPPA